MYYGVAVVKITITEGFGLKAWRDTFKDKEIWIEWHNSWCMLLLVCASAEILHTCVWNVVKSITYVWNLDVWITLNKRMHVYRKSTRVG